MMLWTKRLIKQLLPTALQHHIRRFRQKQYEVTNARKSSQAIFSHAYARNRWGGERGEIFSGSGSRGLLAERSARIAANLVAETGSRVIVDIGCGDFAVSAKVLQNSS